MAFLARNWLVFVLPSSLCVLAYLNFFVVMENEFDPRYMPMPLIIGVILAKAIQKIRTQKEALAQNTLQLEQSNRDLNVRQKQSELALQKLQTTQTSALIALGAVHDIRNLLSPIIASEQLLAAQKKSPAELIGVASSAAQRCVQLSNKVLSGIQQTDFNPTKLRFDNVIRGSADDVHALLHRDFELKLDLHPAMVFFDQDDLTQILYNLISNAVQSKPHELIVQVTGSTDDTGHYVMDIIDNGPGVPDHIVNFDPDVAIHSKNGEIHGLGLTLVHRLIARNQGQLRIERQQTGSLFRMTVPYDVSGTDAIVQLLAKVPKPARTPETKESTSNSPQNAESHLSSPVALPPEPAANTSPEVTNVGTPNLEKPRSLGQSDTPFEEYQGDDEHKTVVQEIQSFHPTILIVDDSQVNCQILEAFLRAEGITIKTVFSGFDAIEIAEEIHFDVILMDIEMPFLDGISTTKSIQSPHALNAETPVIAVTSHGESRISSLNGDPKLVGHLSKPIDREMLYQTIRQILEEKSN